MLLEEINKNHEGTYDFFYLPIDFKNKCNVGYAFLNFIDPSSVMEFCREFHGNIWARFNSVKHCACTFARMQGTESMVARFQNSSLMLKEEKFKPLLYYSEGERKGQRRPFPGIKT